MDVATKKTEDNVFTISQLTDLIKTMLEGTFSSVQIKGEISNFRPNSSGHLYFVLKDTDAQISAVMFRGRATSLSFTPKDGMLVIAKGSISVYPPRGNYQIIITSMTKAGTGDIMEMIEERKQRLAKEGLFEQARKKPLPFFARTIGIVTSPTGAALRDILQITQRRNNKVNVTVLPSLVQGEGAAESIIAMINVANKWNLCDVLIVGRGGGSLEDLLPFSDEGVVRAIANSHIPVISAVGHEIDWALSDFVADVRAPTPSAAAELAVPLLDEITQRIQNSNATLKQTIQSRLYNLRLILKTFTKENMELQFRTIEQPYLVRFDTATESLKREIQNFIANKKAKVKECTQVLQACNPQEIFNRGYSMVTDEKTGLVIRNAKDIKQGTSIVIRPATGKIKADVKSIELS